MKMLLYCTKGKPYLLREDIDKDLVFIGTNKTDVTSNTLNGKIVGECDYEFETETLQEEELCKQSCLTVDELNEYLDLYKEKEIYGYAIHLKNLHIFDKPKELSEYYTKENKESIFLKNITKAPQNMMYCFEKHHDILRSTPRMAKWYKTKEVLISIHPEWLCKILNGEKTIEVRKKVLKEMLKDE